MIFTIVSITGYIIGIVSGIIIKDQNLAIQASPLIMIPLVIFGGLCINLNSIPSYSYWIQFLTPIRYAYIALTTNQLKTDKLYHLGDIAAVR